MGVRVSTEYQQSPSNPATSHLGELEALQLGGTAFGKEGGEEGKGTRGRG